VLVKTGRDKCGLPQVRLETHVLYIYPCGHLNPKCIKLQLTIYRHFTNAI